MVTESDARLEDDEVIYAVTIIASATVGDCTVVSL
jgi:hypothetical protein